VTAKPLAIAISLLLSINALADEAKKLDEIVVRASPLKESATHMTKPAEVLADDKLDRARSGTLGETLRGLPGVQSTQFGQAVARPILRGLDGGRVLMAQGGVSAMDVSTVSVDHAVSIEPFLADQIEVLKGPASLFYGTGAIGGVVNVEDGRLPELLPERINGRVQLERGSVADETNFVARVDGALGQFAWHADAFNRDADAYDTPIGIVENSALETRGAALGSTWISEGAHLGVAISRYENEYGIPNEEAVLNMAQTRIDAHGGVDLDGVINEVEFRAGVNNYRHLELEGAEIGTRFDNDEVHLRIDAAHQALAGWNGVFGVSGERRENAALGEEAFLPPSTTRDVGLFLVEQKQGDVFDFTVGARFDRNRVEANNISRSFSTPSASLAAAQHLNEQHTLVASFDFATRAPQAEELFSDGPHAATQNFEIGDDSLDTERARSINIGWRMSTDRTQLKLDFYHTRFSRFIYLQPTGEIEDELPVFQWQQQDARFSGFDFSADYQLWQGDGSTFAVGMLADRVGAQFEDGTAIPRLSPRRLGLNAQWQSEQWRFSAQALRYARPSRLASFETPTKDFYQLDADLSYQLPIGEQSFELYLQAKNLTNQLARLHTSFLKDSVPLPGRNIKFGVRWFF
jgi:iron complex outermembrane recepter protein